ncbi:PadR family transcriptional regulator [Qipengyuania sp. XHP0211]|uniref:PadR family transcriptional regulator n=1 Tax=Qipengyuania sp. XHP0211 TaxID=3038079 RepID=UPI00241D4248|nr:PadR family transcriptional regulator [Qipengyuania sp. XHP0211]MDG5749920.1 PadR family transcriptional regulator [Qipengyuania sp. XHP0211]
MTGKDERDEPLEGNIPDHPEGEDFDVDVDIEDDVDPDRDGSYSRTYSASGFFGPEGVFGPKGPFGPDGPFGPGGPFGPNGPFGNGSRRSGGKHRARRRRMFAPGELRLLLLHLIAEEPRHGYELIKAVEDMTGGNYSPSPGTVYPTLSLLEDEGLIREVDGDEPRKAYRATEKGRGELVDRKDEIESLVERIEGQRQRRAKSGKAFATPEMFRAVGNLATVLKNRAKSGQLDEKTMREIVDLVDDLAKKIERL